jgi:hypothetical protein
LHAILHRRWPSGASRNIEIAIGCTDGVLEEVGVPLHQQLDRFYLWFKEAQILGIPGEIHVTMRLMPLNNGIAVMLKNWKAETYKELIRM